MYMIVVVLTSKPLVCVNYRKFAADIICGVFPKPSFRREILVLKSTDLMFIKSRDFQSCANNYGLSFFLFIV